MTSGEVLSFLGLGVTVFASTNIDDIVLLSLFFADERLRPRAIVAGQLLGIGVLVLASSVAALGALVVPRRWIALLGAVPLVLGAARLASLWRAQSRPAEDDDALAPRELRGGSQALAVAAVTIANGGDNLGVYIPLFARQPSAIPAYLGLFAVMTGLWCMLGRALASQLLVGKALRRHGRSLLPFVLIALGLCILSGLLRVAG